MNIERCIQCLILAFQCCIGLLETSDVRRSAMYALSQISHWSEDALRVVDTQALDRIIDLLHSTDPMIRRGTCEILGKLAKHKATSAIVLALKPCMALVFLRSDHDSDVRSSAMSALSKALNYAMDFLYATDPNTRRWTSEMLGKLATRESTSAVVPAFKPCKTLVFLLKWVVISYAEQEVSYSYTLKATQKSLFVSPPCAQAAVATKAFRCGTDLLRSTDSATQKWTCELLRRLATHKSTSAAVLACKTLVSLLSDPEVVVRTSAMSALSKISHALQGAEAVVDAKALDYKRADTAGISGPTAIKKAP
ncbi:armadillo-type protein [Mycena leptocephala]|nr:armadillo-type protein [Mycena leptocephala]